MRKFFNIKNSLLLLLLATIGQFTFTACSDEPDAENLYTFTGEMASDYLSSRDKFSEFTKILQRAKSSDEMASYYNLLATYGHYTVFAPTNDAIETYLEENGLSSIDELSVADCDTIARTHIIQSSSTSYFTTDMTDGVIETTNMLDRYLNVGVDTATLSDGTLKTYYTINDKSRLIVPDDSVENGVVHTVDHVLATSTKLLPEYIEEEGSLNMFYEILKQTHMEDSLRALYDENYVTLVSPVFTITPLQSGSMPYSPRNEPMDSLHSVSRTMFTKHTSRPTERSGTMKICRPTSRECSVLPRRFTMRFIRKMQVCTMPTTPIVRTR
jgi:uncharacterized surface protein with fasciclin (FAS1) repeats